MFGCDNGIMNRQLIVASILLLECLREPCRYSVCFYFIMFATLYGVKEISDRLFQRRSHLL